MHDKLQNYFLTLDRRREGLPAAIQLAERRIREYHTASDYVIAQIFRYGSLIYTTQTSGTTFWNVTGLSSGQSYSYQVQAVGGGTSGSLSGGLSATAPPCRGSSGSGIQVGVTVRTTANLRLRSCAGTSDSACPSLGDHARRDGDVGDWRPAFGYTWWRLSGTVNG